MEYIINFSNPINLYMKLQFLLRLVINIAKIWSPVILKVQISNVVLNKPLFSISILRLLSNSIQYSLNKLIKTNSILYVFILGQLLLKQNNKFVNESEN